MRIIVKAHASSRDMIELYRDDIAEIVGIVHVDLFWNKGKRAIYERLRKGEEIAFTLIEDQE